MSTLTAPPRAGAADHSEVVAARGEMPDRARRVVAAALLLFAVYVSLSLFNDPRATMVTDTGGKIATLRAMQHNGGLDPDVHYWAAKWDPDGRLHGLFYTSRVGDKWVNATTVTMLDVAEPLYAVGGIRAALILPMLGSVLAALAARALARRMGAGRSGGWLAFRCVGLASPLAVYALDLWEHSIGAALMLWAVVFAFDVVD
ncbi:MAG TPA: hypothetical protein VFC99_21610, partial [Acidimicrobiia bacterium]|nr:hypothetical protein [Acidimicrobiia bacterium]